METLKEKRIQEIYDRWRGGFIQGNHAMYEVGLALRAVEATNVMVRDSSGKVVATLDRVLMNPR